MSFYKTSCHFVHIRFKYSPQQPVRKHSPCSSLQVSNQVSQPHRTTDKITVLYLLSFMVLDSKQDAECSLPSESTRMKFTLRQRSLRLRAKRVFNKTIRTWNHHSNIHWFGLARVKFIMFVTLVCANKGSRGNQYVLHSAASAVCTSP